MKVTRRRVEPGLVMIAIGLGLLAAGLWARCGWEVAAMVIGGLLAGIGLWAAMAETGEPA